MLFQKLKPKELMNKAQRCLLHFRCILAKAAQGRDFQWHWEHILREFGVGECARIEAGGD